MTEAPTQHLIDPVTLASRGHATHGKSPDFDVITAHPQADLTRRAMVNVGSLFSRKSSLVVFRETEDGARVEEGRVTLDHAPYVHHFGLSARFVTLIEPALLVIMGVVIAAIVLALYMPLFQLTSVMGR